MFLVYVSGVVSIISGATVREEEREKVCEMNKETNERESEKRNRERDRETKLGQTLNSLYTL